MKDEEIIALYSQYHRQLWAMAHSISRDHHLTEDILQEVSVVLLRKADSFDSSRPFLSWTLGITRLQALKTLQKRHRQTAHLEPASLDIIESQLVGETKSELLEQRLQNLKLCLKELSPDNYQIMKLKYISRLSACDISQKIQCSETATHSLLQRLRSSVHRCITRKMQGSI